MQEHTPPAPDVSFNRVIGVTAATLIVAGNVIGTGVFKKIAPMAASGLSENAILFTWIFAGVISILGALTIAGLAKLTTVSGGIVEYLRLCFGNFSSFMLGWTYFIINGSGSVAAVAFIFAQSIHALIPISNPFEAWRDVSIGNFIYPFADSGIKILAVSIIIVLTWVNYRGTKKGTTLNNIVTSAKIIGILALVVLGLFFTGSPATPEITPPASTVETVSGMAFVLLIFAAMINAFWAYDGFANVTAVAGEIKNPLRNLPIAIIAGISIVAILYALVNYAYMQAMPLARLGALSHNEVAGIAVAENILGSTGTLIFSILIIISTFGYINVAILVFARYYYRMAEEKLFFSKAARIHPKFQTPHIALLYAMIWSCILVFSGTFDVLTDLVAFVAFAFYIVLSFGLIKMKRNGTIKEKIWGYPYAPFLFILFTTVVLGSTFINNPLRTLAGIALVMTGIPFYYYFTRKRKDSEIVR